jgi:hypothetical protein
LVSSPVTAQVMMTSEFIETSLASSPWAFNIMGSII